MIYRGFPSKLHHAVPDWVQPGAIFHIRITIDREKEQTPPDLGAARQIVNEFVKIL
jgi:hypothetical protein